MNKNYNGFRGLLLITIGLLSACTDKEHSASVPYAENSLITSDQRLIVSGGENIYEVRHNEPPKPLFKRPESLENCSFSGIAEYDNWLFTSCVSTKFLVFQNKHLLVANLLEHPLHFEILNPPQGQEDPYDEIGLPHGMTFAPDGALACCGL